MASPSSHHTWIASECDIINAKSYACRRLSLTLEAFKLKAQQSQALDAYLRCRDIFVCLPTGYGKSFIFQAAPLCWDFIHDVPNNPTVPKALVVVVVPLKSLALNQLDRCQAIGLEAAIAIADIADDVMESAAQGKYSVLFASPEVLLSERGREFFQLDSVYHRLCGLFIDESHCVSKWGNSSGKTTAFRKMYGNLGELRSRIRVNIPLIAMTATASTSVRRTVGDSLAMRNVALIHTSPVLGNIKHIVHKTKLTQAQDIFGWLCTDITEKGESTERLIIYCQSRKMCGELFSLFRSCIPTERHEHFNMYHTNTEANVQYYILKNFADPHGCIRVLFATIAFGLGMDVKGVHNVIMLGTPPDIDDYIQLSGRAGRDGQQSYSVVLKYPTLSSMPVKDDMKYFMNTESCRREAIYKAFPVVHQEATHALKHNCCDICSLKCDCEGDSCSSSASYMEERLQMALHTGPRGTEVAIRSVSTEIEEQVKGELLKLRAQMISTSDSSEHTYTGPDLTCGLSRATVDTIVDDLQMAFSFSQFCSRYQFANNEIAQQIWSICNKYDMSVLEEGTFYSTSSSEPESEESEGFDDFRETVVVYSDSD